MTNYALGRAFEWRCSDALADAGWTVIRSAGSRGAADLVAVRPGACVLVQCKRGGAIGAKEWEEFYRVAQVAGATPVVALMPGRRGIEFYRVIGPIKQRGMNPAERWQP